MFKSQVFFDQASRLVPPSKQPSRCEKALKRKKSPKKNPNHRTGKFPKMVKISLMRKKRNRIRRSQLRKKNQLVWSIRLHPKTRRRMKKVTTSLNSMKKF